MRRRSPRSAARCQLPQRLRGLVLLTLALPLAAVPALGTGPEAAAGAAVVDDASVWSGALPSDEVLEARGAVIGDVEIVTQDVFDPEQPGENNKLYRLTNRLHSTTRPEVIRQQLLFAEGDVYSRRLLDESERILRRNRYIYDAEIRVVSYRDNRVNLEVRTRDVWTLRPGISFDRSGGVNSTNFKLQDHNLLGTGKRVGVKYSSDVDRDTVLLRYEDPNVRGSRFTLKLRYGDSSDGGVRLFDLGRPFYSLDSRWTAGLRGYQNNRIDSLYALGEEVDEFYHRESVFEIRGGLSRGLKAGRARRWTAGVTFEQHGFSTLFEALGRPDDGTAAEIEPQLERPTRRKWPPRDFAAGDPKTAPTPDPTAVPDDRTLVYPWIAFDSVGDTYEKTRSLDQMGRTEDLELGYRFQARLGYAAQAFGSDRDAAVFDGQMSAGFRPGARQILLLQAATSGRWSRAGPEDLHVGGRARFYWRDFGKHLFYVNVEADAVKNIDADNQLLLGGDSGLRGYPLRYQDGERRLLVTLEQRFFTNFYPFRLFYVGGAVFADIGRTWGDGLTADLDQGTLRDVGFGLRLHSSRSGLGSVLHLDVAFPLDGDDSLKGVQLVIQSKSSF